MSLRVETFFDEPTFTATHLLADTASGRCAIVDPVLDYDPAAGRISHGAADRLISRVRELGLTLEWILETHIHADHLTALAYLKSALGGRSAVGAAVTTVQKTFAALFGAEPGFTADGRQFDQLLDDGESVALGELSVTALRTPGHTPACTTFLVDGSAFVGDTIFMPDFGTARCDFPGGDAATLYRSIRRILGLPEATRLYLCHDYKVSGRDRFAWETTVAEERRGNIHVRDGIDEAAFVALRRERDAGLPLPRLILPSVQVNMRAGQLPPADANGTHYLKIPLNRL